MMRLGQITSFHCFTHSPSPHSPRHTPEGEFVIIVNVLELTAGKTAALSRGGQPWARHGRAPFNTKGMERFKELKKIILERAHAAGACREQYGRAYKAENLSDLMAVVRDNFYWAVNNSVIDGELIDAYKSEFNEGRIWHNENISEGCLLASGSATVEAYDSATVKASDSATVKASDSATVKASDSATVEAYDSATVEAYGSATVKAYGSATV